MFSCDSKEQKLKNGKKVVPIWLPYCVLSSKEPKSVPVTCRHSCASGLSSFPHCDRSPGAVYISLVVFIILCVHRLHVVGAFGNDPCIQHTVVYG